MPIQNVGFCLHLIRIRQEKRGSKAYFRTVGNYQCYQDGALLPGLSGQIVERGGPGDNTDAIGNARDLRIAAGTYPLAYHSGLKYKTEDYTSGTAKPKPGLLLKSTGQRDAILIHPGSDYVWSVGCLNPASGLTNANSSMSFADSRRQVIAIIDHLKVNLGAKFPHTAGTLIPGALIVIEGEPS